MTSLSDSTLLSKQINGVIYCTTNLINFKKYIGLDSRDNPEYFGSGTYLRRSIKKYGCENFKKQILETCSNWESLLEAEIYWIDYFGAVKSDLFYNINNGGSWGFNINNHPNKEGILFKQKLSKQKALINDPSIIDRQKEGRKKTLEKNPEIMLRQKQALKETLKNNPEIYKKAAQKTKQTLLNNPEIRINAIKKAKIFYANRPVLTCPHCNYESKNRANMVKLHFDNCKMNPNFDHEAERIRKEKSSKIRSLVLTGKPKFSMRKPVLQFDLQGNFIAEYSSMTITKKETGIKNISQSCRKLKIAGGFKWMYKSDYEKLTKLKKDE